MQNLRRQHEKPDDEGFVSVLRGPTKHQILGKPVIDVEFSILEDLQRQTKNFTLDEAKPVTEKILTNLENKNQHAKNKTRKSKEKKKKKGNEMTRVKQSYKESFEETRPTSDKTGSRRTIKTQNTMTFSSTVRPITTSKSRKKSRHYTRTKHYDSDVDNNDSVEASGTKKVFMTTLKRTKSLNPHLYEAPNDYYDPISVDQDRENYSMEWDDKYNFKDFIVKRNGMDYKPKLEPKQPESRRRNNKRKKGSKKSKRESGEIPMLDVYGGGMFDHSKEDQEADYENNDDKYYDNKDSYEDSPDVIKKKYQ